uniref:Uncharacterized protein n=1 Tax=Arundo donax TaxID=35708 RepID=A0A0A9C490_ARUDO
MRKSVLLIKLVFFNVYLFILYGMYMNQRKDYMWAFIREQKYVG